MRNKMADSEYRLAGVPRMYWDVYLDEVGLRNKEQEDYKAKLMRVNRGEAWSLVVLGTVGNGKTMLACGLVNAKNYYGREARYTTVERLMDSVKSSFEAGASEANVLRDCMTADLLVLDELTTRNWTEYTKNTVQKILSARHADKRATIVIGNLSASTFKGMLDEHILSRLREGETQIMTADDMRGHGGI